MVTIRPKLLLHAVRHGSSGGCCGRSSASASVQGEALVQEIADYTKRACGTGALNTIAHLNKGTVRMARMSRTKGQRIERELVHLHLDAGIPASRVPLSGAAGGA